MPVEPLTEKPGKAPVLAPAKPKPVLPTGPPHPALQAVGFNGSIHDFNSRLDAVTHAHTQAAGTRPTPGLALDLVRSPVDTGAFAPMLAAAPQTRLQARAKQAIATTNDPVTVRGDGTTVVQTPLSQRLFNHRDYPTGEDLSRQHPWVPREAGFLPIDRFGSLVGALATLDKRGVATANGQITVGGQTLADYERQTRLGGSVGTIQVPAAPPGSALAKSEQQLLKQQGTLTEARVVTQAVKTVEQAQKDLRENYPAFFSQLTADGDFNQDWVRATASFQSSSLYYRDSTLRLAKDNHFDNSAGFIRAWKAKQDQIKSDPTGAALYEHVPLAFFGDGKSVLNYYTGDTHGWGFLNVPTVALHTISGVGKTVVFGAAGTAAASKANAAAATDFLHRVLPSYLGGTGEGLQEAADSSQHVLTENPTWLRVFYPDLPEHPHGVLAAMDFASNMALDIILGNRLVVGGSAVKAGDVAGLRSSRYFKGSTQLAFNSMRNRGLGGVGEASKLLQGGETLNVAVAERIKAGGLTLGQYRAHVEDLYHGGKTELALPPVIEKTPGPPVPRPPGGFAYHGTRPDIAAEFQARGAIFSRHGKQTYFADDPRYAAGHSGDKRLGSVDERGKSVDNGVVFVVKKSEVPGAKKTTSAMAPEHEVGFVGTVPANVALKGEVAVLEYLGLTATREVSGTRLIHASETPNSGVLTTLREKNLPNTSLAHQRVRQALDSYDATLRTNRVVGTSRAADAISAVRVQLSRAAPKNDVRRIYDPRTPDDVFNWVVKNIGDRGLAYKARNDFVVARANQDIPAVNELNKTLLERYAAEYPNRDGVRSPLETTGPESEAESLSYFKFLSGREKDTTGLFSALGQSATRINGKLLGAARLHRQIIISGAPLPGGESLFYKHAVADTLRRFVGGGGLDFRLNAAQQAARADVQAFFKADPAALRDYSSARASAEVGEVAYLTRNRTEQVLSFNTGDFLDDAKKLEGAGAYLRHMVTDDALNAYRASSKADRTPLFRHVWHSKFWQNKIATSEDFLNDAAQVKAHIPAGPQRMQALSDLKKAYAQTWADSLWARYRAIDDAGSKAGLPDALEQAAQVAIEHPGAKIDKALAGWIKDNKIGFDVREAPVKGTAFDGLMQTWIGKLLTFNKLNRKTFFDHVFYDTYHHLQVAGWEKADAVAAATDLAKSQTIYHMLDFSNMLQVEQNLRWLSYYATKHRLYWTWIARQFAKKPLLAAAVSDIGSALDDRGNLNVTVNGHRLVVAAARLVWANNTEYPETSPIVETGVRVVKGAAEGHNLGQAVSDAFAQEVATSGNVITRQDQALALIAKSVLALSGKAPATYGVAVEGMSDTQRAAFNRELHAYIVGYRADHDGAYPGEGDAVKAALLRTTAYEVWRTNLFVPVLPQTGQTTAIQKLHDEFSKIRNPVKRRAFLDKHPELADSFGASQDQGLYLHEQPLWDQFNAINKSREQALEEIRKQIDLHGYNAEIAAETKALSQRYSLQIQRLRRLDALTWKGDATYPAGRVADNGEIQVEGPWSTKLDGDPVAARAFVHEAFPDISKGQLDAHTIGQTVVDLQNEAGRIRQLGWKKLGYPDEQHARDRLGQISQKLDVFRSFPKTAAQQMVDTYYSRFVDPYRQQRDAWVKRLADTPSSDKNKVFSEFRALKEQFDHPVKVVDPKTGQKVTFPSPAAWGLAQLPPAEYHKALAVAAASSWENISGYEKQLLGVKTAPDVANGWALYQKTVTDWRQDPKNAGSNLVKPQRDSIAKQVDKYHPGFYRDYLFSQQPKIVRYEKTSLYTGLSASTREKFDRVIGSAAKGYAQAIKANGHKPYYLGHWRAVVRDTLLPWLNEPAQADVKAELQNFGEQGRAWQDFLNTLPAG